MVKNHKAKKKSMFKLKMKIFIGVPPVQAGISAWRKDSLPCVVSEMCALQTSNFSQSAA